MSQYQDVEGKPFGIIIVYQEEEDLINNNFLSFGNIHEYLQNLFKNLFIPIHSIYSLQQFTLQKQEIIYSNQRKEYKIILFLKPQHSEIILPYDNNEFLLLEYFIDKVKEEKLFEEFIVNNLMKEVFTKPRTLTGKQTNVTLIKPILENNNNQLCVWHKITKKQELYKEFYENNQITTVICLLTEKEGCNDYSKLSQHCNLEHFNFSLFGANINYLSKKETIELLLQYANQIISLLKSTEKKRNIVIHCSAGCHRTGIVAYLVLRMLGLNKTKARNALLLMRRETGVEVGQERMKLVDDNILHKALVVEQ
ncbi:hypothetical protein ABK040_006931 [Willaertia magna]